MLRRALALTALVASANAQAVISIRSGVVHYFEGAVYLNDQPLEARLGKFASMADGTELRTEKGRAEVLLTPGVVLRLDQNSSVRMVSNSLADTRVELLAGSAMVDSGEPEPGTSVTLAYKDWQVRFPEKGVYRVDSQPARVSAREGVAEVTGADGNAVRVESGSDLPLNTALASEQSGFEPPSALDNWARGRADSIAADNQIAANIQDPATLSDPTLGRGDLGLAGLPPVDLGQYGFTTFPMLGLSPYTSAYSSLYPSQLGFYSLYLPGYTYRPSFLLMMPSALPSLVYSRPGYSTARPGVGLTPRAPLTLPRPIQGVTTYTTIRPATPVVRPAPATGVHPVAAPHVGGRR